MKTLVRTAFKMGPILKAMIFSLRGPLTPVKHIKTLGPILGVLGVTFFTSSAWAYNDFLFRTSSFSRESRKDFQRFDQEDRLMVNWSLRSSGESYSDQTDEDFLYGVGLRSEVKYRLLDRLIFTATMDLRFGSGRMQSRFGDLTPNGIHLHYGYFDLDILNNDQYHLMFGSLDQRRIFSSTVMGQRAFPGFEQRLNVKAMDGKMQYRFLAQQVIPTSYTFNTELIAKEELPTLFTALASATYESGKNFDVSGYVGAFSYNDLPSKVAEYSNLLGNSVIGTGPASEFIFGFEGWMAGIAGRYDFNRDIAVGFSLDMLENTSAPDSFNQSQTIRIYASRRISSELGLDLSFGNYFVESDAVPSYYTSTHMGNTNRKGNFIELGLEWVPKKLRVAGRYVKADLINSDTSGRQYDADLFMINLETSYERLF